MPELGLIAKILDEYRIVINVDEYLVKKGDIVQIYEEGQEIKDPVTNESLGRLEVPKGPELIITSVMPNMALAEVNEYSRDSALAIVNPWFYRGSQKSLPENVSVGDKVKKIEG